MSSRALIWCLSSPLCSTMPIVGRVSLLGIFLHFDKVSALGSSFFAFWDTSLIFPKALGCNGSQPSKNTIWCPPTVGAWCWCPLFRLPLHFVALPWAGLLVLWIVSVFLGLQLILSSGKKFCIRNLHMRLFQSSPQPVTFTHEISLGLNPQIESG